MTCNKSNLPVAYPYVPPQRFTKRYADCDAIIRGTLFPELDLPFGGYEICTHLPQTPLTELMKLDFVCLELKLYLDTTMDPSAQALYQEYKAKADEARVKLFDPQDYNAWVFDPWPWEV